MTTRLLSVVVVVSAPMFAPIAALAMPVVGDIVGTDPATATAALEAADCTVDELEAKGGKIEAQCKESATSAMMEV